MPFKNRNLAPLLAFDAIMMAGAATRRVAIDNMECELSRRQWGARLRRYGHWSGLDTSTGVAGRKPVAGRDGISRARNSAKDVGAKSAVFRAYRGQRVGV